MSTRLSISKRNALIQDYRDGKTNPDYDIIPSKTVKGKFTVRKRKQPLQQPKEEEQEENEEIEPIKTEIRQEHNEEEEIEEPEVDDQTNSMFNPLAYFQEYQLQVNKLLIEQMKALRQNNKYMMKKQQKYKTRQKQIRDIFSGIANSKDEQEEEPQEEEHHEEEERKEETQDNYFQNDYQPNIPQQTTQEIREPEPEPEQPQYKNEYEAEVDNMINPVQYSSRRDRIKAWI